MKIVVIGAGSWGTAVAALAARNVDVTLWARRPDLVDQIRTTGQNQDYLAGFELPPLRVTSDLEEAIASAEVIVIGVPSHGFRSVLESAAPFISPSVPIVSLTKGIERETLLRMTEVVVEVLPDHQPDRIGVLSGPNLAREIMQGHPAATVIAMPSMKVATAMQPHFMTSSFRVYTNPDVVGAEIAGAVKNVMAIASGIAGGLGFAMNTLAMLITRALAELTRLGIAMGGNPLTFGGLAGVGDLMATCSSPQSRNTAVGTELGKGRDLDDIIDEMNMVAEGVKTTAAVLELAARHEVEMPIAVEVGKVLYEGETPSVAIKRLMTRAATSEGHGIAL